ncbi:small ubiquitin-related modifier 1-like [Punica granatum]|uniref:Ubiquitin-like domain-containing protein n=2 Tax=Punica granatum TaxID=22663 RepID=A0A218XWK3_PUNGR|nr:small ubiquitin-related modifier 1-like [Punica granatum]OWM88989.1 hypothetical protein CDL15_Pgr024007 [Punica granatum]PKI76071.1 hypothetical protein CRG98_003543 [Punica granatum]
MLAQEISDSQDTQQDKVEIAVLSQDQRVVTFTIRRDKKLDKLFKSYCRERELDIQTIQFLYKGNRIKGYQTPNQLKMKNHCEINAMVHQMGGGSGGLARNSGADHGH